MLKSFYILLFVTSGLHIQAQTEIDSLFMAWQDTEQEDSTRTKSFYEYIWKGFLFSNPDTAFILAEELHAFGENNDYPKAHNYAYNIQGISWYTRGALPRALELFIKNLESYEQSKDKNGIAGTLNNIGLIHKEHNDNNKALEYYIRALKIKEEIGDPKGISVSLKNIGSVYRKLGDYRKALDYNTQGLNISKEINDQQGVGASLNNIGVIYELMDDIPKAIEYHLQGLIIGEQIDNQRRISISLINLGTIYDKQGNYHKAIEYCERAYQTDKQSGQLLGQESSCECLFQAHKELGRYKEALKYHEEYKLLQDSIFNEKNTKDLTRLEMQYDFDIKDAKVQAEQDKKDALALKELQKQKIIRNSFVGGFILVLLFAQVFFKQRNRIKLGKKRSDELLLNILPEKIAEELKDKGHSDAQLIDHVTVLFTDFKGFTTLSEQVSPKELVADLHECFSAFDLICEKYGIEKIKTIGDAFMAAGGLPTPNTTHANDVAQAALEMAKKVEEGKAKKQATGEPFFEIRIGIHTGPVVAGIVGVKKFQYDIWGDTVNTASCMESSGEVGQVNISQTTYELLKNDSSFSFESRGKIEAKGKGEIEMYFVSKA